MAPLLIPLAEENPLLPAPLEIIMAVVFALLLWFLIAKYVVPVFERTYAERTEAIQGGIEKAERAQAEAQAALEQYRAQLAESRSEAARIREDAKTQGTQILAEMREQAQAEATRIREQTQAQLGAERAQVMNSLRNEIGGLATTLAGRIVGETLTDDERARRTVDRFIADLEREQDGAGRDGAGQVGAGQDGAGQDGAGQDAAGQAGAGQDGARQGESSGAGLS